MTARAELIRWLCFEISEQTLLLEQHLRLVAEAPTPFHTETGRIMSSAREKLIERLKLELEEQEAVHGTFTGSPGA